MNCRAACQAAVLCLFLLGAGSALAQDPTKVAPKNYKFAFENDHVQVLYVHYGPHERSALHDHPGGVVVVLTPGRLKFTDEKGRMQEVFSKPGESRWFPPFKHRVENLGDTPYNAVYIGIKRTNTANAGAMDAKTQKILAEYLASLKP